MRIETKYIKDIIKSKYPNLSFRLKYKATNNYVDSSDKVIITLEDNNFIEPVVSLLRKHVYGIKVYRRGEIASVNGNFVAKIMSCDCNSFIEPELLEFIEVNSK